LHASSRPALGIDTDAARAFGQNAPARPAQDPLEPQRGNPTFGFRTRKLAQLSAGELGIRFAFGAGISVVASIVGLAFSPVVGGMFLAFPAILPATLTLLEREEGTEDAVHNVRGAVLGAIGLVAFALIAAALFTHTSALLALVSATAGWVGVSLALYLSVASWRRAHKPRVVHTASAQ
jgi:hypothetical protein